MTVRVIIGKNFGDEGKGLATDYFSAIAEKNKKACLVIRHNGGGQAGHTVDLKDKRFVFHQLSSGSFRNADTYWSKTFMPDLYKLSEEVNEFSKLHDSMPSIYASGMCRCICIDDVLINMALEASRGSERHGSCGMGINEGAERSKNYENCLYLGEVCAMSQKALYEKLLDIRKRYLPKRLESLGLKINNMGEYGELLRDNNVLLNFAEQMHLNCKMVTIKDESLVNNYEEIIFEGAQGLLLDEDYHLFAPHLTTSKTGSDNPAFFIKNNMPHVESELVYVTRSYITRHGAGPLPYEECWNAHTALVTDNTNLPNPWQGALRFAPHGTRAEFFEALNADTKKMVHGSRVCCMVTHLNETDGAIYSIEGKIPVKEWFTGFGVDRVYLSATPFSEDISTLDINTVAL